MFSNYKIRGKMFPHALVKDSFQNLYICALFNKDIIMSIILLNLFHSHFFNSCSVTKRVIKRCMTIAL